MKIIRFTLLSVVTEILADASWARRSWKNMSLSNKPKTNTRNLTSLVYRLGNTFAESSANGYFHQLLGTNAKTVEASKEAYAPAQDNA